MVDAVAMVELWRGGIVESVHRGHAVICDAKGIVAAWGDPDAVIFPRSSAKMLQALPLIESGAASAHGLTDAQLALACASHKGAHLHVDMAERWVTDLGLAEGDLRCGVHDPDDREERNRLIREGAQPCQYHNNCSGKHAGFLTVTKHLKAGPEYLELDHPLQRAIRAAHEDATDLASQGHGIDGCSAPNFATTVRGLARAMATFAAARDHGMVRERAMHRLTRAMAAYPELIAGEGAACTELMRAMGGKVAIKYGAEAVYVAILPELGLGMALKIVDGGKRASETAIAALLVRAGVLEAEHPATRRRLGAIQRSWRGIDTGILRASPGFAHQTA